MKQQRACSAEDTLPHYMRAVARSFLFECVPERHSVLAFFAVGLAAVAVVAADAAAVAHVFLGAFGGYLGATFGELRGIHVLLGAVARAVGYDSIGVFGIRRRIDAAFFFVLFRRNGWSAHRKECELAVVFVVDSTPIVGRAGSGVASAIVRFVSCRILGFVGRFIVLAAFLVALVGARLVTPVAAAFGGRLCSMLVAATVTAVVAAIVRLRRR